MTTTEWVGISQAETKLKDLGYTISYPRIKRFIREGLLKVNDKGKINWLKLKAILDAEIADKLNEVKEEQDYNELLKKANAKYRAEKARLAELERKQKEGELIAVKDVQKLLAEIGTVLRSQLDASGEKLTSQIIPYVAKKNQKHVKEIIQAWKKDVYRQFYENTLRFKADG